MQTGARAITATATEIKLPPASHSLHAAFKQCPRKAWHRFVARDVEGVESEAMAYGKYVHDALEKHIGQGEKLPPELAHHAHLYRIPREGYHIQVELKLGITINWEACDFFADHVFARGVIDMLILNDENPHIAILIDHKSGKVREDPEELKFHACLLHAHYPQLTVIKGWYNWLRTSSMGKVHDLSDTEDMFDTLVKTHWRIDNLLHLGAEAFAPKQGPLCLWCPVKTCEFHP